jgi:hypothetical protein
VNVDESGSLSKDEKVAALQPSRAPAATDDEDPDHVAGWYDATVMADYWFALSAVTPTEAAQLLSCENPHDPTISGWLDVTSVEMAPDARRKLLRGLEDEGGKRPLIDWLQFVKSRGWRHDPWIDRYIAAKGASLPRHASREPSVASGGTPKLTREQRQAARYQACVDAGLNMPKDDYARLPVGISEVAQRLSITRQSLAKDLKQHLARLSGRGGR